MMQNHVNKLQTQVGNLQVAVYVQFMATVLLIVLTFINPPSNATSSTGDISIYSERDKPTKNPKSFTASEYAEYTDQSLETIYRKANAGKIDGAAKVDGFWVIPKMATKQPQPQHRP